MPLKIFTVRTVFLPVTDIAISKQFSSQYLGNMTKMTSWYCHIPNVYRQSGALICVFSLGSIIGFDFALNSFPIIYA